MSEDNVVRLELVDVGPGYNVAPDAVLESAKGKCLSVVVVGVQEDGSLYVASSDGADKAYITLARGQKFLLGD